MGEELAAKNPFLYFVDHQDPNLVKAVQEGRKREFQAFAWRGEPPDPATDETFESCILTDKTPAPGKVSGVMTDYYRQLIDISKDLRNRYLLDVDKFDVEYDEAHKRIALQRLEGNNCFAVIFSFSEKTEEFHFQQIEGRSWKAVLQSSDFQLGQLDFPEKRIKDSKFDLSPFSATVLVETKE
jgi:maltooligosyltrehalose trehalohydrolase